jgi:hypothetical protein
MPMYELSLRDRVSREELFCFLSRTLGVDMQMIGDEFDYWDRVRSQSALSVGVGVRWSDRGYRTFLTWVQDSELSDQKLLSLAKEASEEFKTDVAIGNVLRRFGLLGEFLIIDQTGQVFGSEELSNSDVFELSAVGAPTRFSDVVSKLE